MLDCQQKDRCAIALACDGTCVLGKTLNLSFVYNCKYFLLNAVLKSFLCISYNFSTVQKYVAIYNNLPLFLGENIVNK